MSRWIQRIASLPDEALTNLTMAREAITQGILRIRVQMNRTPTIAGDQNLSGIRYSQRELRLRLITAEGKARDHQVLNLAHQNGKDRTGVGRNRRCCRMDTTILSLRLRSAVLVVDRSSDVAAVG